VTVAGILYVVLSSGLTARAGRPASAASDRRPQAVPAVTFNADIAPLLYEHCAGCHRPGQAAPFSLLTYEDAAAHASQIEAVTRRRYMPPWKPVPGYGDFENPRRLEDKEIALIQQWVAQGRPRGGGEIPPPPSFSTNGWTLGQPDVVVALAEAYELKRDGTDVFRTFVVPIPVNERRYVRALEFDPGNPRAVHHANLKIDATRSSRWLDAQEPGPGYEGAGARGAAFPDGYFLGWTPGQSPLVAPAGLSWRLAPSSDLVIELHMMPTGKLESVQPRVAFYFTDQPPVKLPYMLRLGRQDIDIPAGEPEYVSTDSYVTPISMELTAVQPHAHGLAREMRGFATLPDGSIKWLVYIDDWDPRWQDVYHFRTPIAVPKGTRLTMRYTYDNSEANVRNPASPPRRVTFGQTSSAEMGDLWIQAMPENGEDRQILDRDYAPKMLDEDIKGIEKMLEHGDSDPRLHADLGFCYIDAGRVHDAIEQLEAAARLEPLSAGAQYDAGTVLLRERRFDEAREYFRLAVTLKPDFSEAYNNLGVISHAENDMSAAMTWYSRAVALDARNAEAEYNLGRALASTGEMSSALQHYQRALQIKPDDAAAHSSLAALLASSGEVEEAVAHYRRALELSPDLAGALVDLAWILATSDRTDIRAPAEAIRLATRVDALTDHRSPTVLDTLAAAYAAAGQFDEAIVIAERALDLASVSDVAAASAGIRARLDLYRQQR
jgi:Flp pilus assembly protein TadD/mono/diheme cytochrome c family protein